MEDIANNLQDKTNEDLKDMINQLRKKAIDYSNQNEVIEKDIAVYRSKTREIIQKIPEITEICTKRTEYLEKIRRFERKLLALYTRFPGIINEDSSHVLTSDISSLKRHLDNACKRKEEAEVTIEKYKKELDALQAKKVELTHEDNMQDEIMAQREQEKSNLAKLLRQELDTAKKLYTSEVRVIDQRLSSGNALHNEYSARFNMMNVQYLGLVSQINNLIPSLNGEVLELSKEFLDIHSRVNSLSDQFLQWWATRRQVQFYNDRKVFLDSILQSTEERMEESYKTIQDVHDRNDAKAHEIKEAQNMNQVISNRISAAEQKERDLKAELERVRASFVPLDKKITDALKTDEQKYQDLKNEQRSLEIDYQVLSDTSPEAARAFERLAKVKLDYHIANKRLVQKKNSIEQLKQQIEEKKSDKNVVEPSKGVVSLGSMADPRVIITEDAKGNKIVSAGPIEILSRIIFEPANDDPLYPYSYIFCVHTIKMEIPVVVKHIKSAYDSGDYLETRQARLRALLDVWNKWFLSDFQEVSELVSLIGWTAPESDYDKIANVTFDNSIEVDMSLDLVFQSSPLIVAEHLSYFELEILNAMPASEFIGTSWTKPDKWVLAPNIMKMTEHFNTITSYIVTCILSKETPQERGELISRWIEIMVAALDISSFQLVFEIFGSLCNPAITRLAKSWEFVSQENKDNFLKAQEFTSPSRQFSVYMERLKSTPVTCAIPYIGPMLTNLVYTHDGNPSKKKLPGSGEEVLNFSKYRIYSSIVKEIFKPWGRDINWILSKNMMIKVKQMPLPELVDTEAFAKSSRLEP